MQPDLTSTVVGVSGASMGAVTIGLALRLGTRILVDRKLVWEDGLVLLSWLAQIAFCSIVIIETRYGLGKHWDNFDVTYIDVYLKLITMSSVTYTVAIVTAKASLAALYLAVFRGRSCLLHTLNQGLLLFFVCEAIEETAVVTSQCLPAIGAWSSSGSGSCVDLQPFWWTTFACYIVTNILLFFQPPPFLWYKGLPSYDFATLVGIAIVGILTCAIALLRQFAVSKIGTDTTYDYVLPYIWSEIDVCVVLLFSCGLSVRDILHSSSSSNTTPHQVPPSPQQQRSWIPKRPLALVHFRLPRRLAARSPRETAASAPDPFVERMAWLELLNSHSPYVLSGDHRPQLGTQIRIEAGSPVLRGTGADATATAPVQKKNWCGRERIDEVEDCNEKSKKKGTSGIMVTREVVCTVEEDTSTHDKDEDGDANDQDASSSSGPGSVIFMTGALEDMS
ncbi:Satratoxin biosynthesis SC1 cluster protein 4 [Apiospora arundinis]